MAYDARDPDLRAADDAMTTERVPPQALGSPDADVPTDAGAPADETEALNPAPVAGAAAPVAPNSLERLRAALDAVRASLASAPDRASTFTDLYVYCSDLLRLTETRIRELDPEAEITPAELESMCILLGPYRNLTTLTCSVLSLHPQCVVLNHAGVRALRNPRLNFLADYSPDKFGEFVRYAGFSSRGGMRGMYGGDIRLSHAFDRESMQRAQAQLEGSARGATRCLVWKDSHLVTNFLRSAGVDVRGLLERNDKIRFLLPIRNPIDCAISNLRTGHVAFFTQAHGMSSATPVEELVGAVLDEIAWFVALRDGSGRPENFFLYFEHSMGREVLEQMLAFLRLPRDESYLAAATEAFKSSGERRKETRIVERYVDQVNRKFARDPGMRDALLRFARQ